MSSNRIINRALMVSRGLVMLTLMAGIVLMSEVVRADDDSVIDQVNITVPVACTMSGSGMNSHTATLQNSQYSGDSGSGYENGIGKTTLTVFCNDYNGFSVYAIGFTGDSYDSTNHTKLVGANTNETISTAVHSSSDTTSSWAMKVTKVTDGTIAYVPANMSIQNSFDSWHIVPASYTKVAQYHANSGSSATDTTLGGKLETTYDAYVSSTQTADTYTGKVKYTLVHPYDYESPGAHATEAGCIRYYKNGNDVEGTMGCQSVSTSATSATLLASNFSRQGYGFAGWSDVFDYATNADAHFYGPQETITFTAGQYTGSNPGLSLYAVWVGSAGNLQDSSKVTELCGTSPSTGTLDIAPTNGTASLSSVSALTDQRDNETYAIARLADGNCWMIENLRLKAESSRGDTKKVLAQGYGASTTYGNFAGLADAEFENFTNVTTPNSLYSIDGSNGTVKIGSGNNADYRMPRYNNLNTPDNANNRPQNPTSNSSSSDDTMAGVGMYSYGNYYSWPAALANTIRYTGPTATDADGKTSETVNTSLCPRGWKLPRGGNKTREATNDFWALAVVGINNGTNPANYDSDNNPYYDGTPEGSNMSNKLRAYPNNFLYSGYYYTWPSSGESRTSDRGIRSVYWASTTSGSFNSYTLNMYSSRLYPGTNTSIKNTGATIRCMVSPSA